jgi:type VII secretion effector (TIGR04197 family)
MARIRVNTEDLQAKAKDFETAADAFARAGDDIAAAAMSMPSYDGQLSGPARKAGYEIQSQAREMKTALTNDALYLQKAAQDFEAMDNQTVEAIGASQASLTYALMGMETGGNPSDYPHPPYDRMVAGSDISYEYQPENRTIIIVYKGKFYTFPFDPNDPSIPPEPFRGIIDKIIHNCDDVSVAAANLDGDLLLTGIGLIPFIGDIAMAFGIVWQSLRDESLDLWGLGTGFIAKGVEQVLEGKGKEQLARLAGPILGTIASIPTLQEDFKALADAYNEAPSLEEIHRLCDPNNRFVISVKDDIVDHDGFSPVPVPQDPQSTPTPPGSTPGAGAGSGSTATPSNVPSPAQTPAQIPTQTPTPTDTQANPASSQTHSDTPPPTSTPSGTPPNPFQTTTPDPTVQPTQTPTQPSK